MTTLQMLQEQAAMEARNKARWRKTENDKNTLWFWYYYKTENLELWNYYHTKSNRLVRYERRWANRRAV